MREFDEMRTGSTPALRKRFSASMNPVSALARSRLDVVKWKSPDNIGARELKNSLL